IATSILLIIPDNRGKLCISNSFIQNLTEEFDDDELVKDY
ncbi:11887_t:CDS:1, partial [Gigaspora margarita]